MQDLKYALRTLARTPGFTLVAALTLALGIGATAAIFSVARTVLLQPLPYEDAGQAVMIWSRWVGWDKTWVSEAELLDFRTARTLRDAAAWSPGQVSLTGDGTPERVGAAEVTPNLFTALGVQPALGRGFTADEENEGRSPVVILSHELWQRRYAGDPRILNHPIRIDGVSFVVVGIMPPGFRLPTDYTEDFAEPTRLWAPLTINHAMPTRGNHGLYAAARLAPGATIEQANAELAAIIGARTRQGLYHPTSHQSAIAVALDEQILGEVRPRLFLLAVAVGLLLLIACVNVANLLLARAEGRLREMALRTAVGAGRLRLARQLLTEAGVLAVVGAMGGILLAWVGVATLALWAPGNIPRIDRVRVDWAVVGFAALVSLATAIVFGLVPVARLFRSDLVDALKEGGHGATVGVQRQRMRGVLVAAEVAFAIVLLVSAGLMVRTLWALTHVDLGFDPEHVLTLRTSLPQADYPKPEQVVSFYERAIVQLQQLPNVTDVGAVRSLPLGSTIGDWGLDIDGYVSTPGNRAKGDWQVVTDGAIETMGEHLVAGRLFTRADRADSAPVAIVNETMVRKYWDGESPVGRRMRMGSSNPNRPWITVVGVVRDLRHNGLIAPVKEKFYIPHTQFAVSTGFAPRDMTFVLRSSGDAMSVAGQARAALARLDQNVPVSSVRRMTEVVSDSRASSTFTGLILGVFASLALLLSAIGLYGVLAYIVSQRTREIGIRLSLGATPQGILRLVLWRGLALSAIGVVAGLAGAFAVTQMMSAFLYGVGAHDPFTFIAVAAVLLGVATAASAIPALRAARVNPLVALRTE